MIDYETILFTTIMQVAETANTVGELAEVAELRDLYGYTPEQALELTKKMITAFDSAKAAAEIWVPILQDAIDQHQDILETLQNRQQPESEKRTQRTLKPFCSRKVKW